MFIKKTELISAPFFLEGKVLVDFLNPNVAVFYRIHMVLKSYGKGFVFHSGYASRSSTSPWIFIPLWKTVMRGNFTIFPFSNTGEWYSIS